MIKKIVVLMLLAVFLASCGGAKRAKKKGVVFRPSNSTREKLEDPADVPEQTEKAFEAAPYTTVEGYINAYAEIAKEEMRKFKIPASITMAQAILESGAGHGELTTKANNHFGIKCHDWQGDSVTHDDDEKGECFRKYVHPKESFEDHSTFLTGRSRYAFLFDLETNDYVGWAKGLRQAGYATDRKYPEKLIALIERYELYKFDEEVTGREYVKPEVMEALAAYDNAGSASQKKYTVVKGDTLYSISRKYNITVDELKKYNNLSGNTIEIGQVLKVSKK
ncbi:MAG: N-acetylmuramidase [Cytophagaceae bacterium]|nr:N-acetylmuramidase [Cytophagaceae bacterium]|tara:strand:- start:1684 stop:2520 length:837 start_codon:yes stop_codon:yes gene_type:complete